MIRYAIGNHAINHVSVPCICEVEIHIIALIMSSSSIWEFQFFSLYGQFLLGKTVVIMNNIFSSNLIV